MITALAFVAGLAGGLYVGYKWGGKAVTAAQSAEKVLKS
jgi:hypothetical protein